MTATAYAEESRARGGAEITDCFTGAGGDDGGAARDDNNSRKTQNDEMFLKLYEKIARYAESALWRFPLLRHGGYTAMDLTHQLYGKWERVLRNYSRRTEGKNGKHATLETYACTAIMNLAHDLNDREKVRIHTSLYDCQNNGEEGIVGEERIPAKGAQNGELEELLETLMAGLSSKEREAVRLQAEGYTLEEVGERVGRSKSKASS